MGSYWLRSWDWEGAGCSWCRLKLLLLDAETGLVSSEDFYVEVKAEAEGGRVAGAMVAHGKDPPQPSPALLAALNGGDWAGLGRQLRALVGMYPAALSAEERAALVRSLGLLEDDLAKVSLSPEEELKSIADLNTAALGLGRARDAGHSPPSMSKVLKGY